MADATAVTPPMTTTRPTAVRMLSAHGMLNAPVRNREGEDLGNIQELMIDLNTGQILYAVLSFRGDLGAEKYFAIPWEAVTIRPDEQVFIVDVDKEKLENASGFERNDWPMQGNWALIGETAAIEKHRAMSSEEWEEARDAERARKRDAMEKEWDEKGKGEVRWEQARGVQEAPESMRPSTGRDIPPRQGACAPYQKALSSPDYDREWLEGMFTWFGVSPYWCE
ncbi:MAG TPA: PRC-barrel domain-containing protein [Methanomicrobiales archaeon]|nr:PRC-barrel domain-containing protein [Methanomicrobiales archaeon]